MTDSTGSILTPISTHEADIALVAQLLNQILDKAHPLLAEGLYLAAVTHKYDTAMFKTLRARNDGRDERLAARLARFSFVVKDDTAPDGPRYAMLTTEREILQRRWIETDPAAFVAAHRRALAFWEAHPHDDPFAQDQSRLHHLLVVDGDAGLDLLADTFRAYTGERRLAAVDRLLSTASETRAYLAALSVPWLADLDDLLAYLTARLAQFRGEWPISLSSLEKLCHRPDLAPQLVPYVARAYGLAMAKTGLYVEALEQYQLALETFARQPDSQDEQAFTMIGLGDAHVDLAVSARGYREVIPPAGERWQRWLQGLLSLRALLPLIAYLSLYFGLRVWHPKFWPMLHGQDWIIARLFVTGVRWYRRARQLLDTSSTPAGRVQADEKLAHLYLTLGDATQAASSFRALLEEQDAPLGEYRRASVQAGLGQAWLRLGQPDLAWEKLQEALPVIRAYDDVELEAQIQGLLAEALIKTGKPTEALGQFSQALRLYQKQRDTVGATEIAERLQELARDRHLDVRHRETASTTTQNITRRQYLSRFQHPALVTFRRAGLILLALFIFLIPMLAIHVETGSLVLADIHFHAEPLLELDPDYSPTLNQAVALNVAPSFEAEFVFRRGIELVLLYLLAYTALGIVLIARTNLKTVQAAQAEAVRFDLQGLTVGRGETERTVRWGEISRISIADTELFGGPMSDNSMTVVATPHQEITIKGSTAWYTALQGHICAFATRASIVNLGYRVLRSRMGLLYVSSGLSIILFLLLRAWAPAALTTDLLGTPYSLADFYPALYLGLLLPPFWWIVIRPLQIQAHLNPRSPLAWWIGGCGVLLALLRWATVSQTWLPLPDVYPWLAIIILLGSAGVAIWTARLPDARQKQRGTHVYPLWVRGLGAAAVVAILTLAGLQLWREAGTCYYLLVGNSQRDGGMQAQAQGNDAVGDWLLEKAVAFYDRALALSPQSVTALNSRAAVRAQLSRYEDAITDYTTALRYAGASDQIYASRAMAYEGWGMSLSDEGTKKTEAARSKFAAALDDFGRAIHLDLDNADYYLQRGVMHHALGQLDAAQKDYEQALDLAPQNAQALTGRGWVLWQKADELTDEAKREEDEAPRAAIETTAQETFAAALESFETAARYDTDSPEIWLAVGYAHFKLKQYQDTVAAWERAIELAPDDPVLIIFRGTGHWLLAEGGRCRSATATEAEKGEAVYHLNLAIDNLNRALALRPDDHLTYRTRAQIEFLLRYCPEHDYKEQIEKSIASYNEALTYAPENDLYWQFRARLGTVLARYIFLYEPEGQANAWAVLAIAAADINRAYDLDPENESTLAWRDYITEEAWGRFYQIRGWEHYEAGHYRSAEADSEMAALLLPQDAEVAFNTGLAALAQGKASQAEGWYQEGQERAAQDPATCFKTLQTGIDDLSALLEANLRLRWLGAPILEELQAAADAAAK